ncbi:hypothetical protein N9079_01500 [bacterium]|nr:hypothetical protein [bacterium]
MQHGSIEIINGDCFDRRFETKHITQPKAVTFSYARSGEKTGENFRVVVTPGPSSLQSRYASEFVESPAPKGSPAICS